ncbi:MAG: dipeptidase PepE [Bacteroidota bacterium]
MKLLLLSNSTNTGEDYLAWAIDDIKEFLGDESKTCLFIPYAGVSISFDAYCKKVKEKFAAIGHRIKSVHLFDDPVKAVEEAEVIVTGGGNTFHLNSLLQVNGLIEPIRKKIKSGVPYIGWSAGSNVACPTICTTNDMPIIEPESFNALNIIPFQINPHYLDANPEGHGGETREMRIEEYIEVNPDKYVVGLREGTGLSIHDDNIRLFGKRPARIFKKGMQPMELDTSDNFQFLI